MLKTNILNMIGFTPLMRLKRLEKEFNLNFEVYAKLECYNPTGSVKDRPASNIIDTAFFANEIHEGDEIVEATSGNMGISLAMYASLAGLKCRIYMPKSASIERQKMMKMYGAEVVLVDGGMKECTDLAKEYARTNPGTYFTDQFNNSANYLAHFNTGMEIVNDLSDDLEFPVMPDYFVAGIGTGGTITGTALRLNEIADGEGLKRPIVIGVEPASSPLLNKGEAHPHKIQGIGANFVPSILDRDLIHEIVDVSEEDAYKWTRYIAKRLGIFVGISSGAALAGVMAKAKDIKLDSKVVVIFPDSGNRYLSVEGLYE